MTHVSLPTPLRRTLEKTIRDARIAAEAGVTAAIRRLGIDEAKAPGHLDDAAKVLRRRLRAHARTLGDTFDKSTERQEVRHLVEAAAYAHWHRMLFARFLAERNLLRHPGHDVPVSLADCEELAADEGLTDGWTVAERYAAAMLPAVFQPEDPVLALELAPEHQQALQRLVTKLDATVFAASDSLGWTYQFWRAAEKDAVNKSGVKIGADELAAVTQLFTESYMVRFLLHNTLGAWWAGKVLSARPELGGSAPDEDSLRTACALPGVSWDMLRFVKEDDTWRPAAGTFPGWPTQARAITLLDPCCGSGHFLTEALPILGALRQAEEELTPRDAVPAVLRDNLFGLELDGRCVQIAAFAVALTAWKVGGWQSLPLPHIAWVGAPPPLPCAEFVALGNGDVDLAKRLGILHDLFVQAPTLGSLIDPSATAAGTLFSHVQAEDMERAFAQLVERLKDAEPELEEGAIAARGMADAAAILNRRYTLLTTNVPYLGRGKHAPNLADFIVLSYPEAKADLATTMLARMVKLAASGGSVASVTPQSWLFLEGYKQLRATLLQQTTFNIIGALGSRAFETISGDVVNTALIALSTSGPSGTSTFAGIDANESPDTTTKARELAQGTVSFIRQSTRRDNPGAIINIGELSEGEIVEKLASVLVGVSTSDSPQYIMKFWEWQDKGQTWEFFQTTVRSTQCFGGMTDSIIWDKESGKLATFAESVRHLNHNVQNWRRGKPNWGKSGISVSMMGELDASLYTGERYDTNCCAIVPHNESDLAALWCWCSSDEFHREVRVRNKNMKIEVGTILSAKFDLKRWRDIAASRYPDGLPAPYSDDCTQWLFHGHPAKADPGSALHVALARLSGYRWPAESDGEMHLSREARASISQAAHLPTSDDDGILCLPAVAGDRSLADRIRAYLAAAFGTEWSDAKERQLVAEADARFEKKVVKDANLEGWLRDRAFRQHCDLFHQRPFLWHVWDGTKDGFGAFLHYHRLSRAALEKLTYTTLGDWMARAKAEGNLLRQEKGRELQQVLEKILEGEKPFDIFVRWKGLERLPLGWDPDLDDGVRMNIRPFVEAGILRDPPATKWTKDRGQDVNSAPWFHVFKGERINDHHTTLAEKRAARETAAARVKGAA